MVEIYKKCESGSGGRGFVVEDRVCSMIDARFYSAKFLTLNFGDDNTNGLFLF